MIRKDAASAIRWKWAGSFVDGKGVGDVGNLILRDRRHLSNEGLVVVLMVLNNQTGELLSGPEIISRGFISEEEYPELIQEAKEPGPGDPDPAAKGR